QIAALNSGMLVDRADVRQSTGTLRIRRSVRRNTRNRSSAGPEPLKPKINVIEVSITRLRPGQGIHPAQTGGLLSGAQFQKASIIRSGVSVDQVLADHVGQDSPLPSLVLACEQPMTGYHKTNFSLAYRSHNFLAQSGLACAGGGLHFA